MSVKDLLCPAEAIEVEGWLVKDAETGTVGGGGANGDGSKAGIVGGDKTDKGGHDAGTER